MSRIRSKNSKPEMVVRKFLHGQGLRFRLHVKDLPGKPDLVLRKYKTAIFIHGCFWHGHEGCRYFVLPKTNEAFWKTKIFANKERDKAAVKALKKDKWRIIEIWECEIKSYNREKTLEKLLKKITTQ